ncbi:MAG: hypothetical protein IJV98_04200 [Clostridia bacterium]|nr:hypothetical protein [Clostridia bacterium]
MTEQERKQKWEAALRRYEATFYGDMPCASETVRYSMGRYRRTLRLARKEQARNRALPTKKMAVLLAAAICTLMMLSAAKQPITDSLIRIYERYIALMIREETTDAPEIIEDCYNTVGYLPKGYYRERVDKTGFSVQTVWRNRANEKLILYQTLYSATETMMGKESDYELISIRDIRVMYIERGGGRFYFFDFAGYAFELSGSRNVAEEEYILMISNLVKGGE